MLVEKANLEELKNKPGLLPELKSNLKIIRERLSGYSLMTGLVGKVRNALSTLKKTKKSLPLSPLSST